MEATDDVWQDNRSGNYDIYANRVSAAGLVGDGAGLRVSEVAYNQQVPSAASNGRDYLVVWQHGSGGSDIYANRVSVQRARCRTAPALP